jgi:membrane-bound lytic murein transglycosylase B
MRLFLCLAFLLGSTSALAKVKAAHPNSSPKTKARSEFKVDTAWLQKEMTRIKLPKSFIKESIATYEKDSFKTVTTLNLLGFLQPPGQHMNHVTPKSVKEAARFVEENQQAFDMASGKYNVPAPVISSLLWIETRHGEDMGTFHTTSVYLHLLQVNLPENRKLLTKLAFEKNQKLERFTAKELRKRMKERTFARAQWAREQLGALAVLRSRKQINLKTLRGSYAGAFGLPQFIPSSYKDFAQSLHPKEAPDLSNAGDAIVSVAHYLAKHGWNSQNPEARVDALMKYNNSRDYADSILEISKRVPAGRTAPNEESTTAETSTPVSSAVSSAGAAADPAP